MIVKRQTVYLMCVLVVAVLVWLSASPAVAKELDIYVKVESFTWKEYDEGTKLLDEEGPLFGIGAAFTFPVYQQLNLKVRGELFGGQVDYDGQTWAGTPVQTDVNYFGSKLEADAGWKFPAAKNFSLEPFWGFGYRWWLRDLESTSDAQGYEEVWQTVYARLGLRGEYLHSKLFKSFAEAAVKLPLYNENRADLDDIGLGVVKVKPGKRASFYSEVGARYRMIKASIYYESMRFSRSDVVDVGGGLGLIQPKSKADMFGVNVGVSF